MEISRVMFDDAGWYCCHVHQGNVRGPTYCAQVGVLGKYQTGSQDNEYIGSFGAGGTVSGE